MNGNLAPDVFAVITTIVVSFLIIVTVVPLILKGSHHLHPSINDVDVARTKCRDTFMTQLNDTTSLWTDEFARTDRKLTHKLLAMCHIVEGDVDDGEAEGMAVYVMAVRGALIGRSGEIEKEAITLVRTQIEKAALTNAQSGIDISEVMAMDAKIPNHIHGDALQSVISTIRQIRAHAAVAGAMVGATSYHPLLTNDTVAGDAGIAAFHTWSATNDRGMLSSEFLKSVARTAGIRGLHIWNAPKSRSTDGGAGVLMGCTLLLSSVLIFMVVRESMERAAFTPCVRHRFRMWLPFWRNIVQEPGASMAGLELFSDDLKDHGPSHLLPNDVWTTNKFDALVESVKDRKADKDFARIYIERLIDSDKSTNGQLEESRLRELLAADTLTMGELMEILMSVSDIPTLRDILRAPSAN
jgi:hypothetical protein